MEKSSLRKEKAKRRFIPIDPAPTPAEASEPPRKRRSVKKPKQEAEPKKVLEINLWSMVKWFFAN